MPSLTKTERGRLSYILHRSIDHPSGDCVRFDGMGFIGALTTGLATFAAGAGFGTDGVLLCFFSVGTRTAAAGTGATVVVVVVVVGLADRFSTLFHR